MTKNAILETIKTRLDGRIHAWTAKSERRIYLELAPEDVPDATRLLFEDLHARFQIASGVDTPNAIEILYHWAFDEHGFVVSVQTRLDREHPVMASLAEICTGTEWIEREIWELLGVTFTGHPDMRHLLLKDDWPAGSYPLRRDYADTRQEAPE